jgi:AcrR family transcriptional regulator
MLLAATIMPKLMKTDAKPKSPPRTPTDRKQRVVGELRRGEILTAARKVFGAKGYEATRMEEIARAAHLAKGTLYLYFPSKDAIYEATVRQALGELAKLTADHMAREPDVAGKIAAFIRVRIAFWHGQQTLYRVILTLGQAQRRRTIAFQREAVEAIAAMLEEGAKLGQIPTQDFVAAGWTMMDAIRGVNERRIFSEGRTIEEDTRFLTAFLLAALGVKPGTSPADPA